ncbi:MAG TPA: dTDP-4-dehydrorhamnose reductase [Vicinamibacterales bacterium]|nr:dTDP-4-dehydrorhamnose reductase [Vicinamibacterales bacterium]
MRGVVTGARGLLGAAVARELGGRYEVLELTRADLDITSEEAVAAAIADARPDLIVNCAAYNDVDGAEEAAPTALRANAFAVLALARAATAAGATLVHFSSDFVFDGETDRPYTEEDRPNPRGTYAASKLLGDWFALEAPRAYVLRVESLFGPPGPDGARRGSLGMIVDRIREGSEVPVFVDRVVSPSYTPDIARAVRGLVERQAPAGLYHCVNTGHTSWAGIAERAASLMGVPLRIQPMTLEGARLRARRPRYCALSNAKLAAAGVEMPAWEDALERFLRPT